MVHIADTRLNFRKAAGSVAVVARVVELSAGRPGGSLASVTPNPNRGVRPLRGGP